MQRRHEPQDDPTPSEERLRRRRLPHWEVSGAYYFITFRLARSLPTHLAEAWRQRKQDDAVHGEERPPAGGWEARFQRMRQFDTELETCTFGPRYLAEPAVAASVCQAITHFRGSRYELPAFNVMPNHAHLVIRPLLQEPGRCWKLEELLHSIKSFSSNQANRLLGRSGEFWQREYYDHLIRSDAEFTAYVEYTLYNPVAAGLCAAPEQWPWGNAAEYFDGS